MDKNTNNLTNDFANLSAERVEDRLAMVFPDELFTVEAQSPIDDEVTE